MNSQAREAAVALSALGQLWKRLPSPVRAAAHKSVQNLVAATTAPQVWLNWRRGMPPGAPVSVAGFFSTPSGVGEAARLFANALELDGVPVARLDVSKQLGYRTASPAVSGRAYSAGVLVSFLNPPELLRWLPRGGAQALKGKRHAGYWFWELPEAPDAWKAALRYVDEVWCQSVFTAQAIKALAPRDRPPVVLPHPIFAYGPVAPDRSSFGFSPQTCVVLAVADLRSTAARKNPMGALKTFLKAAPTPDPTKTIFVCKIRGEEAEPSFTEALRQAAADRPDIRVIRGDFSDQQMRCLIASIDVAISLHRAEGFGLLAAEAMWLGKPVVTTAWSGVLDFASASSAVLVDYNLVPVDDPQGVYRGGLWADPDIADAARKLRALIDDPQRRAEIGARARLAANGAFNREDWLTRARSALGLNS